MRRIVILLLAAVVLSVAATDADTDRNDRLRKALTDVFPDLEITRIRPSPVPGLHEVLMGTNLLYLSEDARYVLQGDLIDLNSRLNLSDQERAAVRKQILASVPESETIDFAPEATQHTVYVFTDISCGYCRRFHRDMADLNSKGIAVRYLAFPRAGPDSETFKDMESIWCAADQNEAMTQAKLGNPVTPAQCDNPVRRQYELGASVGVRGTPAIYLEGGEAVPGYVPPDELLQALSGETGEG